MSTTLHQLIKFGQSPWLDYIDRQLLETGKLQALIEQGLRGMTSNPTIFHQAVTKSTDYDKAIMDRKEKGKSTFEIYDELTIRDIQQACDIFRDVNEKSGGLDGFVSLEINPQIAHDTQASVKEGKRLFAKVKRPNCMIKVPATEAGFPVVEELLASGVNVNVTLIFSPTQYVETVGAYLKGLTRRKKQGGDLHSIRSVASVFVSRIDTMVDKLLTEKMGQAKNETTQRRLEGLKGKAAVANCRIIFEKSKELFMGEEFRTLAKDNAHVQRILWGSTSTKNPEYSDIKYVTELIASPTVNTMPEATLQAFLDHGRVQQALLGPVEEAQKILVELKGIDIDIDHVCTKLLAEGVSAFATSFVSLMEAIEKKAQQLCAP